MSYVGATESYNAYPVVCLNYVLALKYVTIEYSFPYFSKYAKMPALGRFSLVFTVTPNDSLKDRLVLKGSSPLKPVG